MRCLKRQVARKRWKSAFFEASSLIDRDNTPFQKEEANQKDLHRINKFSPISQCGFPEKTWKAWLEIVIFEQVPILSLQVWLEVWLYSKRIVTKSKVFSIANLDTFARAAFRKTKIYIYVASLTACCSLAIQMTSICLHCASSQFLLHAAAQITSCNL